MHISVLWERRNGFGPIVEVQPPHSGKLLYDGDIDNWGNFGSDMEFGFSDTSILVGCSEGILVGNSDLFGGAGWSDVELVVFPTDILVGIVEEWFLDKSDNSEGDIVGTSDRLDCVVGWYEVELVAFAIDVFACIVEGDIVGMSDVCNSDRLDCFVCCAEVELVVFPTDVLDSMVEEWFLANSDIIEGNIVGTSDRLDCVVGWSEVELVVFPTDVVVSMVEEWFLANSDIIEGDIVGIADILDCAMGWSEVELVVFPIDLFVSIVDEWVLANLDIIEGDIVGISDTLGIADILDCVVGCAEVELVVFPIDVLVNIVEEWFLASSDIIGGDIVGIADTLGCAGVELVVFPIDVFVAIIDGWVVLFLEIVEGCLMDKPDDMEGEVVGNIDNLVGLLVCIPDTIDGDIVGNSVIITGKAVGSDIVDGDAVAVPKNSDGSGVFVSELSSLLGLICWPSAEGKEILRRSKHKRCFLLILIILLFVWSIFFFLNLSNGEKFHSGSNCSYFCSKGHLSYFRTVRYWILSLALLAYWHRHTLIPIGLLAFIFICLFGIFYLSVR